MKYLRYVSMLFLKVFGKIFGIVWYYVAVPFRAYSRNVVYNYVLQNNIYLPRLLEREPTFENGFYELKNIRKIKLDGFIEYRKISKIEYYLVLWLLWVWVDDDSNYDTYDGIRNENHDMFGNAFDLGDVRGLYPMFNFKRASLWNIRNAMYNFNYMFEEIRENDPMNFYVKFHNLGWHFGYIPYSNSSRKGRLVWFAEDYDKLDKE